MIRPFYFIQYEGIFYRTRSDQILAYEEIIYPPARIVFSGIKAIAPP